MERKRLTYDDLKQLMAIMDLSPRKRRPQIAYVDDRRPYVRKKIEPTFQNIKKGVKKRYTKCPKILRWNNQ